MDNHTQPQVPPPVQSTTPISLHQKPSPRLLLLIVGLLIVFGILLTTWLIVGSMQKQNSATTNLISPTPTVPLKEEYNNPFSESSNYKNPFETSNNPFDSLTQ